MILVVAGAKVLERLHAGRMDRGVLKLLETPRQCLVCSNFSLIKHGIFWKEIKKSGITTVLPIQRVRCRKCPSTFSCFYDFLVPYRQNSQDDLMTAIEHRLSRIEQGTTRHERSNRITDSTVSRVFNAFLGNVGEAFRKLQFLALNSGVNPLTVPQPEFVSSYGSHKKRTQIRVAISLLNLAKHLYGRGEDLLKEISALWTKKFQKEVNFRGAARRSTLSRTHGLQYVHPCSILLPRFKLNLHWQKLCDGRTKRTVLK